MAPVTARQHLSLSLKKSTGLDLDELERIMTLREPNIRWRDSPRRSGTAVRPEQGPRRRKRSTRRDARGSLGASSGDAAAKERQVAPQSSPQGTHAGDSQGLAVRRSKSSEPRSPPLDDNCLAPDSFDSVLSAIPSLQTSAEAFSRKGTQTDILSHDTASVRTLIDLLKYYCPLSEAPEGPAGSEGFASRAAVFTSLERLVSDGACDVSLPLVYTVRDEPLAGSARPGLAAASYTLQSVSDPAVSMRLSAANTVSLNSRVLFTIVDTRLLSDRPRAPQRSARLNDLLFTEIVPSPRQSLREDVADLMVALAPDAERHLSTAWKAGFAHLRKIMHGELASEQAGRAAELEAELAAARAARELSDAAARRLEAENTALQEKARSLAAECSESAALAKLAAFDLQEYKKRNAALTEEAATLQGAVDASAARARALQDDLCAARAALQDAQGKLESREARLQKSVQIARAYKQEIDEFHRDTLVASLEAEVARLTGRVASLAKGAADSESSDARLRDALSRREGEVAALRSNALSSAQAYETLASISEDRLATAVRLRRQHAALYERDCEQALRLREAREAADALTRELSEARFTCTLRTEEADRSTAAYKDVSQRFAALQSEHLAAASTLGAYRVQLDAFRQRVEALTDEANRKAAEHNEMSAQIVGLQTANLVVASLQEKNDFLQKELVGLHAELQRLHENCARHRREADDARNDLAALQREGARSLEQARHAELALDEQKALAAAVQDSLHKAQLDLVARVAEISGLAADKDQLGFRLEALTGRHAALAAEHQALQGVHAECRLEAERAAAASSAKDDIVATLNAQVAVLTGKNTELVNEVHEKQLRMQDVLFRLDSLEHALAAVQGGSADEGAGVSAGADLACVARENARLRGQLDSLVDATAENAGCCKDVLRDAQAAREAAGRSAADAQAKDVELGKSWFIADNLRRKLFLLAKENRELRTRVKSLEATIGGLTFKVQGLQKDVDARDRGLAARDLECTRLRNSLVKIAKKPVL